MLINCPRCGFSQPKDQYCANCGVNIDKYVPEKVNFVKKLLSNTFVQVSLVVCLTLGVSYFALKSRSSSNETALASHRRQIISGMSNSSAAASAAVKNSTDIQAETQNAKGSTSEDSVSVELSAQSEIQKNQLAGTTGSTESGASPSEPVAPNTPEATLTKKLLSLPIKYSFYEVDRELLNYWLQLNNLNDQSEEAGGFQSGLIASEIMHKQMQNPPLKTETKKIGLTQKEIFNAGTSRENSDSFIGFISEVKLDEINENQLKGTLRLTRKNSQGSDLISVPLSIPKQNAIFIHWKNDVVGFDREPSLNNIPPFQILQSPRFRNLKTELVIIVEPLFN